jgi:hypothetical protein
MMALILLTAIRTGKAFTLDAIQDLTVTVTLDDQKLKDSNYFTGVAVSKQTATGEENEFITADGNFSHFFTFKC